MAACLGVAAIGGTIVTSTDIAASQPAVESSIVTIEPTRALDTRFAIGLPGRINANQAATLDLTGTIATSVLDQPVNALAVPDGATGVIVNATAVGPTGAGFVSIRPGDQTGTPSTSNLNVVPGQTVPNAVTVALPTTGPAAGTISIWYGTGTPGATTDLIIDIVGYTTQATTGTTGPQGPPGPTGPAGQDGTNGDELYERTIIVNGDDTPTQNGNALEAALDVASASSLSVTAWQVRLGPGIYDLGVRGVEIDPRVSLVGSGVDVTEIVGNSTLAMIEMNESTLMTELSLTGNSTGGGEVVRVVGDNATLRDLRIDIPTSTTKNAVDVFPADGVLIDRVHIESVETAITGRDSEVTITNSTIISTADSAIAGVNGEATDFTITNSHVETSGPNDTVIRPIGPGLYTYHITHSTLVSETGGSLGDRTNDPEPDQYFLFHNHIDVADNFTVHFDDAEADAFCAQNSRLRAGVVTASDTDCY